MSLRFSAGGDTRLLGGTFVLVLLAVGTYYYFRSTANESRLRDRNLRELARIARTIEARVDNFDSVLKNLAKLGETKASQAAANIPGLSLLDYQCPSEPAGAGQVVRLYVVRDELRFCHGNIHASWRVAELQTTLRSAIFDELFLADASGTVLLTSNDTSVLRLRRVPGPRSDEATARAAPSARPEPLNPAQNNSQVQNDVIVAGHSYVQFLQPVCVTLARTDSAAGGGKGPAPDSHPEAEQGKCWMVGGLASTDRFRAETLALESPHLVFLGLLVTFVVLALPFLRVRFRTRCSARSLRRGIGFGGIALVQLLDRLRPVIAKPGSEASGSSHVKAD